MPAYELALILKTLPKPELASALKRVSMNIINRNGLIFNIENLGSRKLPFVMKVHSQKYDEGSYFLIKYTGPTKTVPELSDECARDVDIIRAGFSKADAPEPFECTLDEELKPAAYRKDVQELLEKGKKKDKFAKPFIMNTGFEYDPWRT